MLRDYENQQRHLEPLQDPQAIYTFLLRSDVRLIPLAHDLVSVWKVATRVLHLRRVGVTDLVVRASVVGALDHDDVSAGTAQLDGVTLT